MMIKFFERCNKILCNEVKFVTLLENTISVRVKLGFNKN